MKLIEKFNLAKRIIFMTGVLYQFEEQGTAEDFDIESTILVKFWYQNRNPNWPILSADTVADTETTFHTE